MKYDDQHQTQSLYADRVYEALKDDIFEFRLLPGDKFSEGDV
ncbi:MAG: hypothetical protein AWU57_3849, partial [Marinobacter sp. T13-3]